MHTGVGLKICSEEFFLILELHRSLKHMQIFCGLFYCANTAKTRTCIFLQSKEWKSQRISLSVPFPGEKYIDIKSSFEINNCDICIKWGCCCLCYTFVTSFLATGNFLSWTKLNPIFSLLVNPWFCLQKGWVHMIFFLNYFSLYWFCSWIIKVIFISTSTNCFWRHSL